jgi:hypothetical protein
MPPVISVVVTPIKRKAFDNPSDSRNILSERLSPKLTTFPAIVTFGLAI